MRVIFMGSPPSAVPSLEALLAAGHTIPLVVSQGSQRAGRGLRPRDPAVVGVARERGLSICQPESLRGEEATEPIRAARADAIVVVAYGKILPARVLEIPRLGCVNVHFSLLPRHRGASPVSAAILAGDSVTGVSIMLMEPTLDTGPVLAQEETPIASGDDEETLTERLAPIGAELLAGTLDGWAAGSLQPIAQDESSATWTRPTTRDDGRLHWEEPAVACWRRVRAYARWPQAVTWWNGRMLRILAADYDDAAQLAPGAVEAWGPKRPPTAAAIGTAKGALLPRILGLEGRRVMPIDAFLRGQPSFIGARLG